MEKIFEDLFTIELANNHRGELSRAMELICQTKAALDKYLKNGANIAIKFQLRNANTFVHKDFKDASDIRYVRKVMDWQLSCEDFKKLYSYIKELGFKTMATPFDESSVDFCKELDVDFIKIASSDVQNLTLLKEIIKAKKPVIASFGGFDTEIYDNFASLFEMNKIPFALNVCTCLYPTEDENLFLKRISDYKERYFPHTIGFSTHQAKNLNLSVAMAYALGARMIERHVDIEFEGKIQRQYTTAPKDLPEIFEAYYTAKKMYGESPAKLTLLTQKEQKIIEKFTRGIYAKKDLKAGDILDKDDIYFAIPLQEGQLSHNSSVFGARVDFEIKKDCPIKKDFISF